MESLTAGLLQVQANVVTLLERQPPAEVAPTRVAPGGGSSIQQRLKSHILKAVADNSAMDHKMASVNSAREQDQALGDMLRGVRVITKWYGCVQVMHDCRNDSAALFFQFGIKLQNVFDTQAAHAALQQQDLGKPVHKVKNVSLGTLCALYGGPTNPRRDQVKSLYRRDQKFWSRRPLSEDMVFHAAFDVFCLLPSVYAALRGALRPESEPLLWALCEEQALAHVSPDEVKQRKKQRKLDHEVDDLRRRLDAARHSARQVVLSNREIRLLRYMNLTEEECARIDGNPKVARKLDRLRNRGTGGTAAGGLPGGLGVAAGDDDDEEEEEEASESESESTDSDLPRSGDWSCDSLGGGVAASPSHSSEGKAPTPITANGHTSENSGCCCYCCCGSGSGDYQRQWEGAEVACQTLSTGDIVITKVFFEEQEHGGKMIMQ
ncbi:hypothetical protein V5799_025496 [Amblyomma americanum]|uniref:3'-5' exonuclease domain-containing protein n=1 Tax=Amblyomma americanum TaxID=6943 RepID=A0AAQ4E9D3_AMBAM